jgi:hypothetical protein
VKIIPHALKVFRASATTLKMWIPRVVDQNGMPRFGDQEISNELIGRAHRTWRTISFHVPLKHRRNPLPVEYSLFGQRTPLAPRPLPCVGSITEITIIIPSSGQDRGLRARTERVLCKLAFDRYLMFASKENVGLSFSVQQFAEGRAWMFEVTLRWGSCVGKERKTTIVSRDVCEEM